MTTLRPCTWPRLDETVDGQRTSDHRERKHVRPLASRRRARWRNSVAAPGALRIWSAAMDAPPVPPQRIGWVACQQTKHVLTLVLAEKSEGAGQVIRLLNRRDLDIDEVVGPGGRAARGAVKAWKLSGRDLFLEYDARSASVLGLPQLHHLQLDIGDQQLSEVREHLVAILASNTCYLIE
jgi:hypothetical protein